LPPWAATEPVAQSRGRSKERDRGKHTRNFIKLAAVSGIALGISRASHRLGRQPSPSATRWRHFEDWDAAASCLAQLGFVGDVRDWPVARMSTGERLRLALVRALVLRPKVLLLDEPTAALDTASVTAVEALIAAQMQAGLAVLWVTHDAAQAKRVARRKLLVDAGRVFEETGA
jgi:ABC-type cobalamin/Fe3+-siderophores transport system ATPase subunit